MSDNWSGRIGVSKRITIPDTTPVVVPMIGASIPSVATLKSSSATRLIEISTDGGVEYFNGYIDRSSATQLVMTILAPVTHIRFTGVAADTWSIQGSGQ